MGFDDHLFDMRFREKIMDLLKSVKTYYTEDSEGENFELWESKVCYNSYSFKFHTLLPIMIVMAEGVSMGEGLTNEDLLQIRKKCREIVLLKLTQDAE